MKSKATDIPALREAAMKATPGPWSVARDGSVISNQCHPLATVSDGFHRLRSDGETGQDAEFIALANPATIIALLDLLGAERQRADKSQADMQFECDAHIETAESWREWKLRAITAEAEIESERQQREVAMETAELLREKVKRLESDLWDIKQLVQVKGESQNELREEVRGAKDELHKRGIWYVEQLEGLEKRAEAAEKERDDLKAAQIPFTPIGILMKRLPELEAENAELRTKLANPVVLKDFRTTSIQSTHPFNLFDVIVATQGSDAEAIIAAGFTVKGE